MSICQVCGSTEGYALPDSEGAWGTLCIPCLEKSKLCDGCNKIHPATEVLVVGNQILCRTCAVDALTCDKCGALHVGGLLHRGRQYCNKCAANFAPCSICGKVHLKIPISQLSAMKYSIEGQICGGCFKTIIETRTPLPVFECKVCGDIHCNVTDYVDTPCKKHENSFLTCICCGKIKHKMYGRNNTNSSMGICDDCAGSPNNNNKWGYCSSCGDYHIAANISGRLCNTCLEKKFECGICHELRDKDTAIIVEGELLCNCCASKCKCIKCGITTLSSESGYCYSCCDTHKIIRVNNYSFKPKFKMFGNGLYLGVENEIANVNDSDKKILASVPRSWMFMKSDASVSYGVECVFHPTTLTYFQSHKSILEEHFSNPNLKQHSSAGMHVHMPKDKFGTYQLFKFIQFFKDHTQFIEKVAGRSANSYSQHISGKPTSIAKEAKSNESGERYRAININNEKTIEVRIFAGVVSLPAFMKNIEFCDALYNFTAMSPHFKAGKIQLSYFVTYVEKYSHMYPNLHVFLGGNPPKEIPEKYTKKNKTEVVVVETPTILELREGCRVRFVDNTSGWSINEYNPLQSAGYDIVGTLTRYGDGYCQCGVTWDNGHSNCYNQRELTAVPDTI